LKNESFAEAGVNKSFYWTNKDVFSSETYRIFLYYDDLLDVKSLISQFITLLRILIECHWKTRQKYRKNITFVHCDHQKI